MAYKTFVCMNIALIGTDQMVIRQAKDLADAGHHVHIGSRDGEVSFLYYRTFSTYDNVFFGTVAEVAEAADVIILSSLIDDVREMAYLMGDVRRKVIIDRTSNNYPMMGHYLNTITAIKAITGIEDIVKVYGSHIIDVATMLQLDNPKVQRVVVGDSKKAKAVVNAILRDVAMERSLDFGGADRAPSLDEITNAWHCQQLGLQAEQQAVPVKE